MEIKAREIRNAILGTGWKACMQCESTGYENWDEDGGDVKAGSTSNTDRCNGECGNCDGVGFVRLS